MIEYYYRYQESWYESGRLILLCHEYPLIKKTPCGVKIDIFGRERFVHDFAKKKFACKTKEDALISFRARKRRQVKILRAQLKRAEAALQLEPNKTIYADDGFSLDELCRDRD